MATVTEMIGAAYDALFKSLNLGDNAFLQLAWPGIALSPADFKDPASPTGPYDPGYAEETFSFLGNIVPVFSPTQFLNSGLEIDDLYQFLISAAIPLGVPLDQLLTNPAYKLFADAQFEFASARHGSRKDASAFYYPCQATPADWYTEANAATWATFSVNSDQPAPPPSLSQFVKRGGAALLAKGVWQLKPAATAITLKASLQQTVQTRAATLASTLKPASGPPIYRPLEASRALAGGSSLFGASGVHLATPLVASSALGGLEVSPRLAEAAVKTQLRPAPLLSTSKLGPALLNQVQVDPDRLEVTNTLKLPFNAKLLLNSLLNSLLLPQPVASGSKNFSISFRYTQVTITRPWLKLALLSFKNWYVPGSAAGEYATGTPTSNPGLFALLPLSFLAIRDLKITAEWSAEDRAAANRAAAFGPFSTKAGTFTRDTLEVPGLQILAAVSRLMPMLPPVKAPAHA